MKNIIMVLGIGINERGSACVMSKHGRVTLIQLAILQHIEIWENGERVYCGPEVKVNYWLNKVDQTFQGLLTFLRSFVLTLKYSRGKKVDVFLGGLQGSGFAGTLLQKFGRVGKTIYFLSDYLPPKGSYLIRLHRRISNWLNTLGAKWSDEVWALSPRIEMAKANKNHFVVPIPISLSPSSTGPRDGIGYIGYPSYDHALDILFEIARRHGFKLHIIGDSPYLQSIKHLAPPQTTFHGLMNDEVRIGQILSKCFCGYAIYRDLSPKSYSYYGFPSKTLYCFASNVPVVITHVASYNHNFETNGLGRVVAPVPEEIEKAVLDLKDNYETYSRAIDRFRPEWNAGVENFHRERLAALMGG